MVDFVEVCLWAGPLGYKASKRMDGFAVSSREVTVVVAGSKIITYVAGARFEEELDMERDVLAQVHHRLNPWLGGGGQ